MKMLGKTPIFLLSDVPTYDPASLPGPVPGDSVCSRVDHTPCASKGDRLPPRRSRAQVPKAGVTSHRLAGVGAAVTPALGKHLSETRAEQCVSECAGAEEP